MLIQVLNSVSGPTKVSGNAGRGELRVEMTILLRRRKIKVNIIVTKLE